ncbi:MAG: hypothetical protein IJP35_08345 [Clostridia bacterium]|nr:hypothetical protein [Clostridia bacterium]
MKKRSVLAVCMAAVLLLTACTATPSPLTATDTVATFTDVTQTQLPQSVIQIPSSLVTSLPSAGSDNSVASVASSKPQSKPSVSSAVSKPPVAVKPETNQTKIVNYVKRPTYASVQSEIAALAQAYPELIQVGSIGTSVQGRDLTMLKVGKGQAKACIVAGIHAREHITVSYTMRCIEEFCAAYTSQSGKFGVYDMVNLLDSYTLYIVPLSNPDGLEIISGRATPNVTITYREDKTTGKLTTIADYKANANGVNLNKNFPLLWDQVDTKRPTPDPENYKGTAAASEPETKALMALCEQNDFMWMTSVHVRGDCLYWSDTLNPKVGLSETIANQLKTKCGFYKCKTSDDVNGYGGGFENWFRQTFQKPGFCLELMPLDIKVTSQSDANHQSFTNTVRWNTTYRVFPIMMIYGFIE